MAVIDRDGLFSGERLAACSDLAQLYWPRLYAGANGYARLELSLKSVISKIFGNFKKPPEASELEQVFREYEENYLVLLYEVNGVWWAQFATSEKFLPRYKTHKDNESPRPGYESLVAFEKGYVEWKNRKSLHFQSFQKSSESFGVQVGVIQVTNALSTSELKAEVNPPFPKPKTGAAAPRGGSPNPPLPDGKRSPSNPTGPKQSKTKAKPPKTGPGRAANGGNDESGTAGAKRRVAVKVNSGAGHLKNSSDRQNADLSADDRSEPCHAELSEFWKVSNRDSETAGELPWEARDRAALLRLLQACPEMTREMFRVWLVNRAHSEGIVFTDPPRNWVSVNLKRYADGPLDRYNKPIKRAPRTM